MRQAMTTSAAAHPAMTLDETRRNSLFHAYGASIVVQDRLPVVLSCTIASIASATSTSRPAMNTNGATSAITWSTVTRFFAFGSPPVDSDLPANNPPATVASQVAAVPSDRDDGRLTSQRTPSGPY